MLVTTTSDFPLSITQLTAEKSRPKAKMERPTSSISTTKQQERLLLVIEIKVITLENNVHLNNCPKNNLIRGSCWRGCCTHLLSHCFKDSFHQATTRHPPLLPCLKELIWLTTCPNDIGIILEIQTLVAKEKETHSQPTTQSINNYNNIASLFSHTRTVAVRLSDISSKTT